MTLVTLDDTAIAEHLARIDADGYTIVEDAIEPDLVERAPRHDPPARARPRRRARARPRPKVTRRCGCTTCSRRIRCSRRCPCIPNVLPIAERLLDRGCLLSGMTAIDIGPGEHPQPMHGDDIVMSRHLPRPHVPMMVTSMWALTDFTADNGGTRFVPGSHRFPQTPESPDAPLDRRRVRARDAGRFGDGVPRQPVARRRRQRHRRRPPARRERAVLPGLRAPAAEPVPRHTARDRGDVLRPAARAARLPPLQGDHGPRRRREPGRGRVRRAPGREGLRHAATTSTGKQ